MWAGLNPANPSHPLAQASGPAGQSNTRALIHAVAIIWRMKQSGRRKIAYLICWRR